MTHMRSNHEAQGASTIYSKTTCYRVVSELHEKSLNLLYPGKNGVFKFCDKDLDLMIGGRQTPKQNPAGCSGESCAVFIADTVICTGFCDDWRL